MEKNKNESKLTEEILSVDEGIVITVNKQKKLITVDEAVEIRDELINKLVELGKPIYFQSDVICTAYEGLFDSCYVLQQHECDK